MLTTLQGNRNRYDTYITEKKLECAVCVDINYNIFVNTSYLGMHEAVNRAQPNSNG